MMAKLLKSLELCYPMIQFLINTYVGQYLVSSSEFNWAICFMARVFLYQRQRIKIVSGAFYLSPPLVV